MATRQFKDRNEFNAYWKQQLHNWQIKDRTTNANGFVEQWKCTLLQSNGRECAARLRISLPYNAKERVTVGTSAHIGHTHAPVESW